MTVRRFLGVLIVLGSAGIIFALGDPPRAGPAVILLSLLGIGLEVAGVPISGFGYFSGAFACSFCLALLPDAGPATGAFVLLAGIVLRSVAATAGRSPSRIGAEALADLIPGLMALTAVSLARMYSPESSLLAGSAAGFALYLPLVVKVPEAFLSEVEDVNVAAWHRHREMTRLGLLAVALLGPAQAALIGVEPWFALWLCPLLLLLHRAARIDLVRMDLLDRETLARQEMVSRLKLAHTREELSRTSQALNIEIQDRRILEGLTATLARSSSPLDVMDIVLNTVAELVPCQSVAIFAEVEGNCLPARYRSPFHEILVGEALARQGEPIVQQCWRTGSVVTGRGEKLFPGEAVAAALPMQQESVLYVGRRENEPFTWEQRHFLLVICGEGGLALQSASRFETQQTALEQLARAHSKLSVWNQRLSFLLESARELATGLAAEAILQRCRTLLEATLPHDLGAIFVVDRFPVRSAWPEDYWTESNAAMLGALVEVVVRNQTPLLVEDRANFRGPAPGSDTGSFVAAPITCKHGLIGAVVLGARQAGAFTREHMDVLSMIAYHAGVALHNAALHLEVTASQAQLVQSSKMAAVGQLAAGVAHELNTPLCSILLGIETAQLDAEQGRLAGLTQKLEVAYGAATSCQQIVAKLLFYARSTTTRQRVDLNRVVEDTLQLFGRQLAQDSLSVKLELGEGLPGVLVNTGEIQQVLINLLLNAKDALLTAATPSPQIVLSTAGGPTHVCLRVADNGPGIDADIAERIFEPFFTTKPVGKGTGLGLSVSHQIVAAHGGRLAVESTPGSGAVFLLELPVATPP